MLISLPWPPTGNHAYTVVRGRKILSDKAREYRQSAAWLIKQAAGSRKVTGRISVEINAYPPDRRVHDLDNLVKLPIDCIKRAGVIADDGDIDLLIVRRGAVHKGGRFTISVEEIR